MRVRIIQARSPRRPTSYRPDAISCAGSDRRTCPYTRVPSDCCSVHVKLVNDFGCIAYWSYRFNGRGYCVAAGGVRLFGERCPSYSGKANCCTCCTKPAGGNGASGDDEITRTGGDPGEAAGCGTSRKESNSGVRGVEGSVIADGAVWCMVLYTSPLSSSSRFSLLLSIRPLVWEW